VRHRRRLRQRRRGAIEQVRPALVQQGPQRCRGSRVGRQAQQQRATLRHLRQAAAGDPQMRWRHGGGKVQNGQFGQGRHRRVHSIKSGADSRLSPQRVLQKTRRRHSSHARSEYKLNRPAHVAATRYRHSAAQGVDKLLPECG